MEFEQHLREVLPADLPHRETVIVKSARHLGLLDETNRRFNLTRITGAREAAIKHVLDSVIPWRLFASGGRVLDAGTGAGFPGIPLSLALPSVHFTLSESIRKKARFVESAVDTLSIANAVVATQRAEELVREQKFDIVTARALAPIDRALTFFTPAVKSGARLILYKGPDVEQEIAGAALEIGKRKFRVDVVMRYDLPEAQGTRTIVEIALK